MSFERDWAEKRTYHRWEEFGNLLRVHASQRRVALVPLMYDPPIWRHFGQMYFDQVLLLLYLRVVLFSVQCEAQSDITGRRAKTSIIRIRRWGEEFQDGALAVHLSSQICTSFPLLSNQQQGVELYSLARQCMEIDDLFEEVQAQIHNSHNYLVQEQDQRQAKEIAQTKPRKRLFSLGR